MQAYNNFYVSVVRGNNKEMESSIVWRIIKV